MSSETNGFYNLSYINDLNTYNTTFDGRMLYTTGTINYNTMNNSTSVSQINISLPSTDHGCFYIYILRPTGATVSPTTSQTYINNYSRYGYGMKPTGNFTPVGVNSGTSSPIAVSLGANRISFYKSTSVTLPSALTWVYSIWVFTDGSDSTLYQSTIL